MIIIGVQYQLVPLEDGSFTTFVLLEGPSRDGDDQQLPRG